MKKPMILESEEQRLGRNKSTQVNHTYINSGEYRRKFDEISQSKEINRLLYQLSKEMLNHRAGTKYEDMYWIDLDTGSIIAREIDSDTEEEIVYSETTKRSLKVLDESNNIMTIHSHPNSFPPSINDIISNYVNKYSIGVIACHDGTVFLYSAGEEISKDYYEMKVAKYLQNGYNEREAQLHTLYELAEKFDFMFKEVVYHGNGKR